MELVTVKTKFQIVIPRSIREAAGVDIGDLLEAKVECSNSSPPRAWWTAIVAEGLADLKMGRSTARTHPPRKRLAAHWSRAPPKLNPSAGENRFSERADKDYARLPPQVRKAYAKQLDYLLVNLRHPSLRAKKFDASNNLWQARVDRNGDSISKIEGDEDAIFAIVSHPK